MTDIAEAQAQGLCWLARQRGLPEVPVLRIAVTQLHETRCEWCDYPLDTLLGFLRDYRPMAIEETRWWALPGKARLAAIRKAQAA